MIMLDSMKNKTVFIINVKKILVILRQFNKVAEHKINIQILIALLFIVLKCNSEYFTQSNNTGKKILGLYLNGNKGTHIKIFCNSFGTQDILKNIAVLVDWCYITNHSETRWLKICTYL